MEHFDKEGDNPEIIRAERKLYIYLYTLEYCHSSKNDHCRDHTMNLCISLLLELFETCCITFVRRVISVLYEEIAKK